MCHRYSRIIIVVLTVVVLIRIYFLYHVINCAALNAFTKQLERPVTYWPVDYSYSSILMVIIYKHGNHT